MSWFEIHARQVDNQRVRKGEILAVAVFNPFCRSSIAAIASRNFRRPRSKGSLLRGKRSPFPSRWRQPYTSAFNSGKCASSESTYFRSRRLNCGIAFRKIGQMCTHGCLFVDPRKPVKPAKNEAISERRAFTLTSCGPCVRSPMTNGDLWSCLACIRASDWPASPPSPGRKSI